MHTRHLLFFAVWVLAAASCAPGTQSNTPDTDSLTVSAPTAPAPSPEQQTRSLSETPAASLIGTWELTEILNEDTPMSMDFLNNTRYEFTAGGALIIYPSDMQPQQSAYSVVNNTLQADVLPQAEVIESITSDKLVLASQVDNSTIRRIFRKVR
ncbi:MAG: lipocalin family protein [Bacteroidia bacterium]|nr:lipocalin family protein [Bacteroidia bacterium]